MDARAVAPFAPPLGLRSAFAQSTLASKRPAHWLWARRGVELNGRSTRHLLDCGDGVRLVAWHTPQPAGMTARGLVVLIHGWEGHHDSGYQYSMACALWSAGYNVARLNLRDHGGTHDLNEELFHSARIAEVLGAIRAIRRIDAIAPFFVLGFSLGGNFALRVALRGPAAGVEPRLVVGISPAINPEATMHAINDGPRLINRYFLDKWLRTLDAKQRAWPGRYDFSAYRPLRNFVEITRRFVADFTEYPTLDDYLAQYTLTPAQLLASPTPIAVITSKDDSVIPFRFFDGLEAHGPVRAFLATDRGGHCGFIQNWRLQSWAEARVLQLLS